MSPEAIEAHGMGVQFDGELPAMPRRRTLAERVEDFGTIDDWRRECVSLRQSLIEAAIDRRELRRALWTWRFVVVVLTTLFACLTGCCVWLAVAA